MRTYGPFRTMEMLGRGGMATVWRAIHVHTGQPVALKVVRNERASDPRYLDAFRDEVRAAARLLHPHIVLVLDHGVSEGEPWLALELVEGGALGARWLPRGWEEIDRLVRELLSALAHAHAHGVVHRDLKPENVLIDDRGSSRLADFGLAHLQEAEDRTLHGGTPAFMAPEQLARSWRDFGPWTDLWALGALVEALVAGQPAPSDLDGWLRRARAPAIENRFARAADALAAWSELGPPDDTPPTVPAPASWGGSSTIRWSTLDDEEPPIEEAPTTASAQCRAPGRLGPRPAETAFPEVLRGAALGLFSLRPPPIVGRERERDELWAALEAVDRGEGPRFVLLRGDAGTGKSHLARWLTRAAHEAGADVLTATHEAKGGRQHGLRPMVTRRFRTAGLSREQARRRLAIHLTLADADDLARWLVEPDPEPSPRSLRAAQVLLARVLESQAERRVLVLWLDDLQWGADALAVAKLLVRQRDARVLILATMRPAAIEVEADVVDISPLDDAAHRELVERLLGPGTASDRLIALTRGIPLFAVQTLEAWIERGAVRSEPRGLVFDAARAAAPMALSDLVRARIDRFLSARPPTDGDALDIACLLGLAIAPDEWEAACRLAGVLPSPGLVGDAIRAGLLVAGLSEQDEPAFAHGLVRDAWHERIHEDDRRARMLHSACADALAELGGDDDARRIAEHLIAAGREAEAVAPMTRAQIPVCQDGRAAVIALEAELDVLMSRHVPAGDPRWGTYWTNAAGTAFVFGDLEQVEVHANRVLVGPDTEDWRAHRVAACRNLGLVHKERGRFNEAEVELRRGIATAGGVRFAPRVALALAGVLPVSGRFEEAEALVTSVLDAWPDLRGSALQTLGDLRRQQGDLDAAARAYADGAVAYEGVFGKLLATEGLAEVERLRGRVVEAREVYRRVLDQRVRLAGPAAGWLVRANLALCALELGEYAEARDLLLDVREHLADARPGLLLFVEIPLLEAVAGLGDAEATARQLAVAQAELARTSWTDIDLVRSLERTVALLDAQPDPRAAVAGMAETLRLRSAR